MSAAPIPPANAAPLARGERFALGVIGAVAGARAMVSISPVLRFDADPAIVPGALAGIGPSGSLLLDALGALAVAKLAWEGRRQGRAGAWCALLILLRLPAFLGSVLQPAASFGDLWRGATWLINDQPMLARPLPKNASAMKAITASGLSTKLAPTMLADRNSPIMIGVLRATPRLR